MSELVPMREQVYADPRPKEHFDRFHERARTREPDWAYELTRVITSLYAYTLLRARAISVEKVPGRGAVILAPNHFSFMDHFLMGCLHPAQGALHGQVAAVQRADAVHLHPRRRLPGAPRRARRGDVHHGREPILAREGAITMYCEGGRSRTGKVAEQAKRGIGRLALETGAPVVPIAIHGSSRVRNWKRLQFPKVTVQYGDADPLGAGREPDARAAAGGGRPDARRDPQPLRGPRAARSQGRAPARARAAPRHAAGPEPTGPSGRRLLFGNWAAARGRHDAGRLEVGGVIGGSATIYVDQASVLMPAAAVVFVLTGIISAVLASAGSLIGMLLALVIGLVAGTLFTGMVVSWSPTSQDGRRDQPPDSCCAPPCRLWAS